jgi:hypothetical protein
MQCRDSQFFIRIRRHSNDELGAEVGADLDRHTAACADCARDSRATLSFDRAVARTMNAVTIPSNLHDKLVAGVLLHRSAVLRRSVYRATALVASVLLAIGLGFGAFSASRPRMDTDALVMHAEEQFQDPEASIHNWLVANHYPAQLPVSFNPDLLVSLGSERIQGKDVSTIVFRTPPDRGFGFAKVYLLRRNGSLNLDPQTVRDAQASNARAIVLKDSPNASGLVYVIVYTGHDLLPFLKAAPTGPA